MIFQVICWKASLHFGYYVIYKGWKGLCANVSLSAFDEAKTLIQLLNIKRNDEQFDCLLFIQ
jgi:hypothetical protein